MKPASRWSDIFVLKSSVVLTSDYEDVLIPLHLTYGFLGDFDSLEQWLYEHPVMVFRLSRGPYRKWLHMLWSIPAKNECACCLKSFGARRSKVNLPVSDRTKYKRQLPTSSRLLVSQIDCRKSLRETSIKLCTERHAKLSLVRLLSSPLAIISSVETLQGQ
jgi:hypothetical protein